MRECPNCHQEYVDSVSVCAEDGTPLVTKKAGARPANDLSRLTTIVTLADQFEADELAQDLADEGFEVALVTNRPPTLGSITTPGPILYSVVVPDTDAVRAKDLVTEWRAAIEQDRSAAERAAEEEEAATEAARA